VKKGMHVLQVWEVVPAVMQHKSKNTIYMSLRNKNSSE
jgi:hypothetical protein